MTVEATLLARLQARQSVSGDFANPSFAPTLEALLQLTSGTGANQADILFADERTVSESSNDDIDLAGVLVNAFGAVITAAEMVALIIINRPKLVTAAANLSDLTIGGEGTNPFEGFLSADGTIGPLKPGAFLFLGAGDAAGLGTVTAGTGDKLRIANGAGGDAVYQIGILARSA